MHLRSRNERRRFTRWTQGQGHNSLGLGRTCHRRNHQVVRSSFHTPQSRGRRQLHRAPESGFIADTHPLQARAVTAGICHGKTLPVRAYRLLRAGQVFKTGGTRIQPYRHPARHLGQNRQAERVNLTNQPLVFQHENIESVMFLLPTDERR